MLINSVVFNMNKCKGSVCSRKYKFLGKKISFFLYNGYFFVIFVLKSQFRLYEESLAITSTGSFHIPPFCYLPPLFQVNSRLFALNIVENTEKMG